MNTKNTTQINTQIAKQRLLSLLLYLTVMQVFSQSDLAANFNVDEQLIKEKFEVLYKIEKDILATPDAVKPKIFDPRPPPYKIPSYAYGFIGSAVGVLFIHLYTDNFEESKKAAIGCAASGCLLISAQVVFSYL